MEFEKSKITESVEELSAAIEQQNGDPAPCRSKASKVEEHFRSIMERLDIRLHDFCERKDVLERIIKAVDSANECCVKTTAKLSEMVASKPDLPECKKQIMEIEVSLTNVQFMNFVIIKQNLFLVFVIVRVCSLIKLFFNIQILHTLRFYKEC